MKVTATLANKVELVNGLFYTLGSGIDQVFVERDSVGPWSTKLDLAVSMLVAFEECNMEHTLFVSLVDSNLDPVLLPLSADESTPLWSRVTVNVVRNMNLLEGQSQQVNLAVGFPTLYLPKTGSYKLLFFVNDLELEELEFRVVPV